MINLLDCYTCFISYLFGLGCFGYQGGVKWLSEVK